MTHEEVEAIVGGYHGDPFRILGPHAVGKLTEPAQWEVRTFLPQAERVDVLPNAGEPVPMQRRHAQGFFTAALDRDPGTYQLRLHLYDGATITVDDAYRFPLTISDYPLYLHGEGTNYQAHETFGAHVVTVEGVTGTRFAVWAPNAHTVSIAGDFNNWDTRRNPMRLRDGGVWELFLPGIGAGAHYKYNIRSRFRGYQQLKADPYGFQAEVPPQSASVVCDLSSYAWQDAEWLEERARKDWLKEPMAIYEVHSQSWLRGPDNALLTYRELAATLVPYVKRMGYTHIEFLPIMEHPYTGSWGYQVVGYFAPTSRHGSPQDFMYFVDECHRQGIGVIVDWVPGHFPKDAHGLAFFDGTALYEHEDPRKGEHKDWGTLIFNYGRNEVCSFLISNALFWLRQYHIDGLRVDAVASMLYLDYSRKAGEWVPNVHGGNENLEAIDLLRRFNEQAHLVPGAVTMAEESTAFPGVSRPVYLNGLGFTMKWNMGWMHDMLLYFQKEPVHRRYHHHHITFSLLYAFSENFVLPISHDEVVYGKRSLLDKMPGDEWQRFANARLFLAYMYAHPGKKLLFMGSELGQYEEWSADGSVRWDLLAYEPHRGLHGLVQAMNGLYRSEAPMHEVDFHYTGFEWIDFSDADNSVVSFVRRAEDPGDFLVWIFNMTPVPRGGYRIGAPAPGAYYEVLNTDWSGFGGSNVGNFADVRAQPIACHGRAHSLVLTLPPLGAVALRLR